MAPASFVHNPTTERPHGSKRGCFLPTSAVSSPKPETWLNSFLVFHNTLAQAGCLSQAFPHNPHKPCVAVGRGSSSFLPWAHGLHTCRHGCSSLMAMLCHATPGHAITPCMVISSLYHPHTSGCWQQELWGARWEVASTSPRCWVMAGSNRHQQPPSRARGALGKCLGKGENARQREE